MTVSVQCEYECIVYLDDYSRFTSWELLYYSHRNLEVFNNRIYLYVQFEISVQRHWSKPEIYLPLNIYIYWRARDHLIQFFHFVSTLFFKSLLNKKIAGRNEEWDHNLRVTESLKQKKTCRS